MPTDRYERPLWNGGYIVAGVDEAGRGPLAGEVVAAACVFPPDFFLAGIDDSKKLSALQREHIYSCLTNDCRVDYGVGIVNVAAIERVNILQAALLAMKRAVAALKTRPDYLLIDGPAAPKVDMPCQTIVRGDELSMLVAAASVIAKVERDRIMRRHHEKWPEYAFNEHKGYGTKKHIEAILRLGPCPIHRLSFLQKILCRKSGLI